MTTYTHQEYINKNLSKTTSQINTLREEYKALESKLEELNIQIEKLEAEERPLKIQKTEFECSSLIEKLKTFELWNLKRDHNAPTRCVRICYIDYAKRQVRVEPYPKYPMYVTIDLDFSPIDIEHWILFECFEMFLEPCTETKIHK